LYFSSACVFVFNYFLLGSVSYADGITLDVAFNAAVKNTEDVVVANSQLQALEARIDQLKGKLHPSITATALYQLQNKEISSLGDKDQGILKLTLSHTLYEGGRDRANINASLFQQEAQQYNVATSKNLLYISVARSFYGLLSANKEVDNIRKSIDLTEKRIQDLLERKKIGKSRNIEVLAAKAQLSVLQAQLLGAIGKSFNARNIFTGITGISGEMVLDDDVMGANLTLNKLPTLNSFLAVVNERSDILSLHSELKSSEYEIESVSAEHFPTLTLIGNYYPYRYRLVSSAPDWDAFLTLSIPIYSGGITQAQIRDVTEKKIQSELKFKRGQRTANNEVHIAYNTFVSAIEQMKSLEKALVITEQNYREQEKDYHYSLATNLDVLQALNTMYETKRSLDRTRYEALNAMAELKAAAGKIEP
jgi:outer membrane protein